MDVKTQTHGEDGYVKGEAEFGVMLPQAEERLGNRNGKRQGRTPPHPPHPPGDFGSSKATLQHLNSLSNAEGWHAILSTSGQISALQMKLMENRIFVIKTCCLVSGLKHIILLQFSLAWNNIAIISSEIHVGKKIFTIILCSLLL